MLAIVNGLIIRRACYRDNDLILTLLTPDHGKMIVNCRGARNPKSVFKSYCNLFNYNNFVLYERNGYYWAKEISPIAYFYEVGISLQRLAVGQYFCELLDYVSVEGEPERKLMRLSLNALHLLTHTDHDLTSLKAAFELRAMAELGFRPHLTRCCCCGKETANAMYFDISAGVLCCGDCLSKIRAEEFGEENDTENAGLSSSAYPYEPESPQLITLAALAAMRYVLSARLERVFSFRISDEAELASFEDICEKYLIQQLGRTFHTLQYYHSLQ